jgi:hypothetical protein
MIRKLIAVLVFVCVVLPVWAGNPSAVASSVDSAIKTNMISRGFASNDPRYGATLTAVRDIAAAGAGAAAVGLLAGGTAPAWGTVLAVSLVGAAVTYGVSLAVNSAIRWAFSPNDITVSGAAAGTLPSPPAGSVGITSGGNAYVGQFWNATTNSLQLSYVGDASSAFQGMIRCVGTGEYYCDQPGYTHYVQCAVVSGTTYNCRIMRHYPTYDVGVSSWYTASMNNPSPATCAAGYRGVSGGACFPITYAQDPSLVPPDNNGVKTMTTASSSLPSPVLSAPVDPSTIALMSNSLWQQAASQPGYSGLPYSPTSPVTASQVSSATSQPTVSDLIAPTSISSIKAAPSLDSTPSPSTNPGTGTQVNLGADPGIGSPAAMDAPDWIAPLWNLLPGWHTATFTQTGTCLKPSFDLSGVGLGTHVMSEHCDLLESQRSAISAIMVVAWAMAAAFIVLRA